MRISIYNPARATNDELEADPDDVFVRLDIGPGGYRMSYVVPFADFCELVRAQIDKPTKAKVKAA
jgi:hypothetical protein